MGDGAKRVRAGAEGSNSRFECPLARRAAVVEKDRNEAGEMAAGVGRVFVNAPEEMDK